jgi:acyl-CoA thioesterase
MNKEAARRQFLDALEHSTPEFERFFLARFFGLRITYGEDPERCFVELPYADFMRNPQGSLHGGVMAFAMDVSMGHLCNKFLNTSVTLDMTTRFLRPVTAASRCEARFLRKGRSIAHTESRLFDTRGQLAAVASGTWRVLEPADGGGKRRSETV